jgi:CoA:oxalate CoA-transferase
MVLLVLQNQWQNLCKAMERVDLIEDPRFADQDSRAENQEALIPILEEWLQTFSTDAEAWAHLEKFRVPSGPVLDPTEAINSEYYTGRGSIRTIQDPFVGEMHLPGFPLRFSEQPEYTPGNTPALGEHNGEILASVLGYSQDKITALEKDGVLISADR